MSYPSRRWLLSAVLVLASCGSSDDDASPATTDAPDTTDEFDAAATTDSAIAAEQTGSSRKPEVEVPPSEPTELVVTDLVEGDGPQAAEGDIVEFDYVGVVSSDGTEFANSYDAGEPVVVTLGANQVIPGVDQGLVGVQAGTRRQIDIPAVLAYGDQGAGEVITPGAAITFVVDIVSVTTPTPPTVPELADPSECPATDGSEAPTQEFAEYPPFCIDVTKTYTAEIVTNKGDLSVELYPERAPLTVNSFVTLARFHYFDGTECHRIIPGFVAQCGDPTASGTGGPGYAIPDELPSAGEYQIGSLAMANAGPGTSGSQFFLITGESGAALPPQYSYFGDVIAGIDSTLPALDAAGNPENNGVPPLEQITIESVTITES